MRAAKHFEATWARHGVTHVIKITGKYWLPELEPWTRAFERCGCRANVLHSRHSLQAMPLWPWLRRWVWFWPHSGSSGDYLRCEVFGVDVQHVGGLYRKYLGKHLKGRRPSIILEDFLRHEVRDRSVFPLQISLPPLENALRTHRGDGSLPMFLR